MTVDEVFQKNLNRFGLFNPPDAFAYIIAPPKNVSLIEINGFLNLKKEKDQQVSFLHAVDNPVQEAEKWFGGLFLINISVIYVYGVGLGYYYEAAKEWLSENPDRYLIFIEDDAEVIYHLLHTEIGSKLLKNPQVALFYNNDSILTLGIQNFTTNYCTLPFVTTTLKIYSASAQHFEAKINFFATTDQNVFLENNNFGSAIFRNFYYNFLELPKARLANKLYGKFKDVPAIICGAGPSITKNIELLAKLQNKALLFAGGTAINVLNAHGVTPHFIAGIDPNYDHFKRLVMNNAYETPFFYRNRLLHEGLQMIHGDKLYVTGTIGHALTDKLEESLEIDHSTCIQEGYNVLNFSLSLAHEMGCNPIICVGIDLSYSGGESYGAKVISHPIYYDSSHLKTRQNHENLISKNDINGKPVFTLWKWMAESLWYTNFVEKNPETTLINATEGGIGFLYVPNMTLQTVKDHYLNKEYDFKTRIHGEIQNAAFSEKVSVENIKKFLNVLLESLKNCAEKCQKILGYHEQRSLIENEEEDQKLLKECEAQEQTLHEELGYEAILKSFYLSFPKLYGLDFLHLRLMKGEVSENELKQKNILLLKKMFTMLKMASEFNGELIQSILQEKDKTQLLIHNWFEKAQQTSPVTTCENFTQPVNEQKDHSPNKKLSYPIMDSEVDLPDEENLSQEDLAIECLYYPDGKVKLEQHYKNNILHGSSTFFSATGNVLARCWYINGQLEGKMWTFYVSGELHSVQRFKAGQPHGLQEYFYINGLPKSVIPYSNGLLEGEVLLYHSKGQKAREVHYVKGKREGRECFWDEKEQMRLQAFYVANLPISTAQMWYSTGVLAKQIDYDENSVEICSQEWDVQGSPLQMNNIDFFDAIRNQMDVLTKSLENVFTEMSEVVKSEGIDFTEKENTEENSIANEFLKLQKEMQKLKFIDSEFQKIINPEQEAIWKNPETQKIMAKEIEKLNKKTKISFDTLDQNFKNLQKNPEENQVD